jgi:hypothetical protein
MNHGTTPPGQPPEPDQLDRLLSAYFKQQLPRHWPAFQPPPAAEPTGLRAAAGPGRSRATLAVSVAALLGLGLCLSSGSGQFPAPISTTPDGGLLKSAEASGSNLSKRMNQPELQNPPGPGPRLP